MAEKEAKITFGGWYQRTTLHLTELYEFFSKGNSRLKLSKEKLREFHRRLDLKSVVREAGYLEYIHAFTQTGIEIKYYEDGLYILEVKSDDIEGSIKKMKKYFEDNFNPAVNYIFSLGAPTPKILSNIKEEHPIVISRLDRNLNFHVDKKFGEVYSKTSSRDVSVYKTRENIFIIGSPHNKENIENIVEMQIFFREFKDQLHRYLNIHRKVWEEISDIKERKFIKGKEVDFYRSKLESYKKTIELISSRINQMSPYAHTRASLARNLRVERHLIDLFQYKFEDLFNTLAYIKDIWHMTSDYVDSSISVLVEIGNKTSMSGIRSIQVLASIGVFTGIVGYLTRDSLPRISQVGLFYLLFLIISVLIIDLIIKRYAKNKRYELKFVEEEKEI